MNPFVAPSLKVKLVTQQTSQGASTAKNLWYAQLCCYHTACARTPSGVGGWGPVPPRPEPLLWCPWSPLAVSEGCFLSPSLLSDEDSLMGACLFSFAQLWQHRRALFCRPGSCAFYQSVPFEFLSIQRLRWSSQVSDPGKEEQGGRGSVGCFPPAQDSEVPRFCSQLGGDAVSQS